MEAFSWAPAILDERARKRSVDEIERWSRGQLDELAAVPPTSMQGVLLVVAAGPRSERGPAIYRSFRETRPELADELIAPLRHLEVRWLLDEKQTARAFEFARRNAGSEATPGTLMRPVGERAREHPEDWPDGLPDPSETAPEILAGFLHGFIPDATRRDEDSWWEAVDTFRSLLSRSTSAWQWLEAARAARVPELFVPLMADRDEFPQVFEIIRQWNSGHFTQAIGRVLRRQPELVGQVPLREVHPGLLRSLLAEQWAWETSGVDELRRIDRIAREWEKELPDLLTEAEDPGRRLLPLIAVRLWDDGQRDEALAKLAGGDLRDFGARLAAELLDELSAGEAAGHLRDSRLPVGTLRAWFALMARSPDRDTLARRAAMLERFGDSAASDPRDELRLDDVRALAFALWREADDEAMSRVIGSSFWLLRTSNPDELCVMAELLALQGDPDELLALADTAPARRHPIHRAILLRALGKGPEALEAMEGAGESPLLETLLIEQGRYRDAVNARFKRRRAEGERIPEVDALFRAADMARVLELDRDGKRSETFEICSRREPPAWIRLLVGYRLDELALEGHAEFFTSLSERIGRVAGLISVLEARALAAASGEGVIDDAEFKSYLRLARYAPDRRRTQAILRRWSEVPPAEVEAMMSGGFMIHAPLFRTLAECDLPTEARHYLRGYLAIDDHESRLDEQGPARFCGWGGGEDWREGPVMRLVRLEHPDLDPLAHLVSLARLRPREPQSDDLESLVGLVQKHRDSLSDADVRRILSSWCNGFARVELAESGDFGTWTTAVRETVTRQLAEGSPLFPERVEFESPPGEFGDPRADDFAVKNGMARVRNEWHAGNLADAKSHLRDIFLRVLLDRELEKPGHIRLIERYPDRGATFGCRPSSAEMMILCAGAWKLPEELVGRESEALCRTQGHADDLAIRYLERSGRPDLALSLLRQRCVRSLTADLRMDPAEVAPLLRRLELRQAARQGDRRGVMRGIRRFMAVDPFHPEIPLEMRAWCRERNDHEGVAEIDRMIPQFWDDRLLLSPDFPPYLREIDRWKQLTARQDAAR